MFLLDLNYELIKQRLNVKPQSVLTKQYSAVANRCRVMSQRLMDVSVLCCEVGTYLNTYFYTNQSEVV